MKETARRKKGWRRVLLVAALIVGLIFGVQREEAEAGTIEYQARLESAASGDNVTFTCKLTQTVDGQETVYQWQEYRQGSWKDIPGATGETYTVSKLGKEGYQYRCLVTVTVRNTYSLMNEAYKAFLHRQGVEEEFRHWWPYLYNHTQDEYFVVVCDTLKTPPVNEAAKVAMQVVFSDEYMKKYNDTNLAYNASVNMGTENGPKQLIIDCYRFLLQRVPSDEEVEYWYTVYVNNNNKGYFVELEYPDGNGEGHDRKTYYGMGAVINRIAASAECAQKMAAAYYYNGDLGAFLYTQSDVENRMDTYSVISDVAVIPSPEQPKERYTVTLQEGTGIERVSGDGTYAKGEQVSLDAVVKPGYHWTEWTGTYQTRAKKYAFQMPAQDVVMTANAEKNSSTLRINPNGGTWNGSTQIQNLREFYAVTKYIPDPVREGYTFSGWVKSEPFYGRLAGGLTGSLYTFGERNDITDVLTASWTANAYTIRFDANGGEETTRIEDIVAEYGTQITLPDGAAYYVRNVVDGAHTAEASEGAEAPRTYPSLYMGWSLEEGKDRFTPQWEANVTLDVAELAAAAGVTNQNGAVISLYAIWDDCPWIQASDLYYTLKQAQSGFITHDELMSYAKAEDREDGSPILPGYDEEKGTLFWIQDYQETDFTMFIGDGSVTETYRVQDSAGNVYKKMITVHIVDTRPREVKPVGTTRFINEYYYNQPYENGGLEDDSIWKTDPEYVAAIQEAFDNLRNNTPEMVFYFKYEDILKMKEFVDVNGVGTTKSEDALLRFYDEFMAPNRVR
ncbi:MAG: InlB B-repeat-containing protein [Clostridiales bacterium]|nr:InlB B-repeat-containing protein [Clostridiales bacterium]